MFASYSSLLCRRRSAVLFAITILFAIPLPARPPLNIPAGKAARSLSVRWQPLRVVNGSPLIFRVTARQPLQSLSGKWLDHEVFFAFDPPRKAWYGIAGVSLETRPGVYPLILQGTAAGGKQVTLQQMIPVRKGNYRKIAVTVPTRFTEPSPAQLQQISEEKTLKQSVFSRTTPDREWSGNFLPPVKAEISDVFGTTRTINGKEESVHQGLDYAVPQGTPVAALNRGTVLLARPLFYEGTCIVLDHGQGLLSLYMHLSKIEVKEGDQITRGQKIGLSGGTGRATGPHLHIAVRWQGIYLDPATLLQLRLP